MCYGCQIVDNYQICCAARGHALAVFNLLAQPALAPARAPLGVKTKLRAAQHLIKQIIH